MLYILAIFLPPLAILLSGWIIASVLLFFIWIPAILFTGGLTHPMFVVLAWLMIHQARTRGPADRRG